DVVGVERMAQAERVGERPEAGERGVRARVPDEERPPREVEDADGPAEDPEPVQLVAGEALVASRSQEYKGYTKLLASLPDEHGNGLLDVGRVRRPVARRGRDRRPAEP